jgi:hypothetical protein
MRLYYFVSPAQRQVQAGAPKSKFLSLNTCPPMGYEWLGCNLEHSLSLKRPFGQFSDGSAARARRRVDYVQNRY